MKKIIPSLVVISSLLLGGCFSMPDMGDLSLGDKLGESVSSSLGLDELSVQMQAFQFYSLYFSLAFFGGYNYETGFSEGQGLRWASRSNPADGEESSFEYERIFLKEMDDGNSWWRIAVFDEGETTEYEYLMNSESEILVIRYEDPESGEIVEFTPPEEEETTEEAESTDEYSEYEESMEEYEDYDNYDYKQYSKGEEKITIPAGTFTAEHMVSEVTDTSEADDPVDVQTDWWIVDSVPGEVIKYIWLDRTDGSTNETVLLEILENQKTKMDSF